MRDRFELRAQHPVAQCLIRRLTVPRVYFDGGLSGRTRRVVCRPVGGEPYGGVGRHGQCAVPAVYRPIAEVMAAQRAGPVTPITRRLRPVLACKGG